MKVLKIANELELMEEAEKNGASGIVVAGVVIQEGKVLLLERQESSFMEGLVELPSGKLSAGETLTEALIREMLEETSLHITSILKYLGNFDYTSRSGGKTKQFNFLVDCESTENIYINQVEHCSYYWVSVHDDEMLDSFNISLEIRGIITGLR